MREADGKTGFAPVDANHDFAEARRKIDRRTQNHEAWAELTDSECSRIDTKFHFDLGGVSNWM